jgi:hypothetical protein
MLLRSSTQTGGGIYRYHLRMFVYKDTITLWIAGHAAIVSTASVAWSAYGLSRDQSTITLKAVIEGVKRDSLGGEIVSTYNLSNLVMGNFPDGERRLIVGVTNTGRRPATLTSWQSTESIGNVRVVRAQGNFTPAHRLEESESFTFSITDFDCLRRGVDSLCVTDSHGRDWPLPKDVLQRLQGLMRDYKF